MKVKTTFEGKEIEFAVADDTSAVTMADFCRASDDGNIKVVRE